MLTFPSSPLSFRTAGFPQSGWKAGISDSAFPSTASSSRRAVCNPPFVHLAALTSYPRSKSRDAVRLCTTVQAAIAALPQGSSLRSGLCCPGPSSLIDPMRPTHRRTSISPIRLIRGALAVRQLAAPRRPVSGSVLSWTVLCRHVIVCDPGKLVGCTYPVPSPTTLAFDQDP
jgi:hypothetical protein